MEGNDAGSTTKWSEMHGGHTVCSRLLSMNFLERRICHVSEPGVGQEVERRGTNPMSNCAPLYR
jgi:hypothetical protein